VFNVSFPIYSNGIWLQLEHFNRREKWGDFQKVDVRLLFNLDRTRHKLNRKISVHCAYEITDHATKSLHKKGMAVDFHVYAMKRFEFYELYEFFKANWSGGIGVYPYWNSPGFHLDVGAPGRTWIRDKYGRYHYDETTIKTLLYNYMRGADV